MKTPQPISERDTSCWTARDASGTLHGFVAEKELRRLLASLAGTELLAELARSLAVQAATVTRRQDV